MVNGLEVGAVVCWIGGPSGSPRTRSSSSEYNGASFIFFG